MRAALFVVALVALGACSWFGEKPREANPGPIYSPNGEPLSGGPLGDPKCEDAMRRWFVRVDTDHDGKIDIAEFLADARRQFAAMDLERTGVLTPAVLAQYRAPYLTEKRRPEDSNEDSDDERHGHDRRDRAPPIGKDRADPVMLADVKLRNRVTLDEFVAAARRNFAALDASKDGRLGSDEVLAACKRE